MDRYVVFLVFLILIINVISSEVIQNDFKASLFYVEDGTGLIRASSNKNETIGHFVNGESALTVNYDEADDSLIWSTTDGAIYSSKFELSSSQSYVRDVQLIYNETRWLPTSIARDDLGKRFYILDTKTNTIRVIDFGGMTVLDVGSRNYRPNQLELDSHEGYIFLMGDGPGAGHILRMNMDGANPKFIDPPSFGKENSTGKMTIDRANKRIIVSSKVQRKIFSMDYEGNILNTVLEPQNGTMSMSITNEELFWINSVYYRGNVSFTDGSTYKCDYIGGKCVEGSAKKLHQGRFLNIRAVSQTRRTVGAIRGPWKRPCPVGWRSKDTGLCEYINEFFIYADGRIVRGSCMESPGCQPIVPFEANLRFRLNEQTGFDYDPIRRQIYYGGKEAIYRADLDTGTRTQILHQAGVFFGPMAVDWVNENVYYTEVERRGRISFYILKVLAAKDGDANRAQRSSSLLWELGKVRSMALHPNRGFLFVSFYNNMKKHYGVLRLNADARNVTIFPDIKNTPFITIDYSEDRLYMFNTNVSKIVRANLSGHDLTEITKVKVDLVNVTGILIYDHQVLLTNRTNVFKYDKITGDFLGEFDLFPYDRDISTSLKLHSPKYFTKNEKNPCLVDNGGCDNFCFALPAGGSFTGGLRKRCRCFDGVKCNNSSTS